jgi:hypothetical protein
MTTEADIDKMSPQELEAAAQAELKILDGGNEPVEPEPKEEPAEAPEPKEGADDPEGHQQPEDNGKEDKAGDDNKGDGEAGEEKNPYRKRIDRLARKADRLESEVSEKERLLAEKEKELAELKAKAEAAKEDEKDEPEKGSVHDIEKVVEKVVEKRDKSRDLLLKKEKLDNDELTELFEKVPNAKSRKDQLLELGKKYPNMSFEALDTILSPADHVDPVEANRKDANRLAPGARSRADLAKEVDPSKMTNQELEKHLNEALASGELVI